MGGNASGTVKLKVALDGETLVNDYQNTLARLQMDFATELVSGGTSGNPGTSGTTGGSGGGSGISGTPGSDGKVIKTGDEADIMKNLIILFVSGLVLLVGGLVLLRRQRGEEVQPETGNAAAGRRRR